MALPPADYPQAPRARADVSAPAREAARACPACRRATAMSGLPPNRPLNANDTDIDNYTAPPEGPFENVDYYQNVMTDYFETMGIPIVAGASVPAERCGVVRHGRGRQRNARQHVLERAEPDRPAAASVLRRSGAVVHGGRRREGREAGRRRSEDRHRVLLLRRSDGQRAAAARATRPAR